MSSGEGKVGFAATGRPVVVALALALAGLVAACGQPTVNGPIVGIRAPASPAPFSTQFDPSSIADSLQNELTLATNTNAITGENKLAAGEGPIENILTLKQTERLAALQQLGSVIIQNRLSAINQVHRQVLSLNPQPPNVGLIVYLLENAAAGLNQMQQKIANDQLVDVARSDVTAVAAFRIYGLLLPQVHMLIAASQLQHLVAVYYTEATTLQGQITKASQLVPPVDVTAPQAALNDFLHQISIISNDSAYAVAVLPGLTAAGYPGNRSTLAYVRTVLNAASNASSAATNDTIAIRADLGIQ